MKNKCNALDWIAMVLVIIGALNWGLVGIFGFDLVAAIFGEMGIVSRIIYILVGISGLYMIYAATKCHKDCKPAKPAAPAASTPPPAQE